MTERTDSERLDWLEKQAKPTVIGDETKDGAKADMNLLSFWWSAYETLAEAVDREMASEDAADAVMDAEAEGGKDG